MQRYLTHNLMKINTLNKINHGSWAPLPHGTGEASRVAHGTGEGSYNQLKIHNETLEASIEK